MSTLSKADHALKLGVDGFNIFPGNGYVGDGRKSDGKTPAIGEWPDHSTNNQKRIRQWWVNNPERNIAIHTNTRAGRPFFVLDVDDKPEVVDAETKEVTARAKEGSKRLAELEAKYNRLPETLTVRTPSGGRHLYFYCDTAIGSSVGTDNTGIAQDLDIRGHNGYVMGPGSVIGDATYEVVEPIKKIAPLPSNHWLCRAARDAGAKADAAPVDRTPLDGVDPDRAVKRGLEYLKTAPKSIKGNGGDATAYRVAAGLKDGGCTEAQALDLMLSPAWDDGCGWSPERLAEKVAHAYRYGKEPPGLKAPEAVFDAVEVEPVRKPRSLIVTCVADVEAKPIEWLWPGVFALGKHSSIAGNPGLGKSQLSIFLAAAVSTGGKLPDGSPCPEGDVLMITMEDDIADTIRPRLEAAGADLKRVSIVEGVPCKLNSGQDGVRSFDMTIDVQRLAEVADELPALRLIIVDPISAFMGATDSHKNAEVRSALTAISKLAESRGAALLSINHLNKSSGSEAMGRVNGSGAFVAQARAVYIVARDKDDETVRVMSPLKNNVGDDRTTFFFKVEGVTLDNGIATSRAAWLDRTEEMSADDALDKRKSTSNGSATGVAQMFLMEKLRDGSQPSKEIEAAAKEAGISSATLRRARESLGIVSGKKEGGKNGAWMLSLPSTGVEKRRGMTAADMFN